MAELKKKLEAYKKIKNHFGEHTFTTEHPTVSVAERSTDEKPVLILSHEFYKPWQHEEDVSPLKKELNNLIGYKGKPEESPIKVLEKEDVLNFEIELPTERPEGEDGDIYDALKNHMLNLHAELGAEKELTRKKSLSEETQSAIHKILNL